MRKPWPFKFPKPALLTMPLTRFQNSVRVKGLIPFKCFQAKRVREIVLLGPEYTLSDMRCLGARKEDFGYQKDRRLSKP